MLKRKKAVRLAVTTSPMVASVPKCWMLSCILVAAREELESPSGLRPAACHS